MPWNAGSVAGHPRERCFRDILQMQFWAFAKFVDLPFRTLSAYATAQTWASKGLLKSQLLWSGGWTWSEWWGRVKPKLPGCSQRNVCRYGEGPIIAEANADSFAENHETVFRVIDCPNERHLSPAGVRPVSR